MQFVVSLPGWLRYVTRPLAGKNKSLDLARRVIIGLIVLLSESRRLVGGFTMLQLLRGR